MAEIKCPECGVTNLSSRATCVACHSILRGKKESINPMAGASPELPKKTEEVKKERKTRVETPPETTSPITPQKKELSPVLPKVKRSRRKRKSTTPPQTFILENGKLILVSVSLHVKKDKKPTGEAKALIAFWNRNKGLLK